MDTCKDCSCSVPSEHAIWITQTIYRGATAYLPAGIYCRRCIMKFIGASPNDFPLVPTTR